VKNALPLATPVLFAALAFAGGFAVVSCTGADESDFFGSPSAPGVDSGATEDDGSTATDDGGAASDGAPARKDGGGSNADSGPPKPDAGVIDAGEARTIGCTLDAGLRCAVGTETCCRSLGPAFACTASAGCAAVAQLSVPCDDALDCAALGHPNELCCATTVSNVVRDVACRKAVDCTLTANRRNLCDPSATDPCPNGGTCKLSTQTMPGFWICF
jgi:hypothetical protein